MDNLAQLGFIVITLGNRGGHPDRSKWYHNYGYGNLRDYGLADKKYVAQQLANRHDFIDINRVGIYGHSGGYINHTVFDRIDYPTVEGTLYENQKLIDLLNMQAGDDEIVGERIGNWDSRLISNNKSVNTTPIKTLMKRYFTDVDGLEPGKYYNYSAMTTYNIPLFTEPKNFIITKYQYFFILFYYKSIF